MTDKPTSRLFQRWAFPGARPKGGGATTDPRTGKQYEGEGYAVGSTQQTAARSNVFGRNRMAHEKMAQKRLDRRYGKAIRSEGYVGAWRDKGKIHYDPVEIVDDYDAAMAKAKERKQKSIYDFKNKRVIPVE